MVGRQAGQGQVVAYNEDSAVQALPCLLLRAWLPTVVSGFSKGPPLSLSVCVKIEQGHRSVHLDVS